MIFRKDTIVDILTKENEKLKKENTFLKRQLDAIESYREEYEKLIVSTKKLQEDYKNKLKEFDKIEAEFKKEIEKL